MFGILYDHLNEDEIAALNGRYKDLDVHDSMYCYFGEEGHCMAEICGDNMEDAEIIMRGIYRGIDANDYDPVEYFIVDGGQKNLEMRKYFSARQVKAIRAQTDLSQEKFAKKVGLKPRTYQNYEEGQRIPSRIILNAMMSAVYQSMWCVKDHRRLRLGLNILSETAIEYLKITTKNLYHFRWYAPRVRKVTADGCIDIYWVNAEEKWEDSYLSETHLNTDHYPEDLAACIRCAVEYGCDEIIFEDRDNLIHGDYAADDPEYKRIAAHIGEIKTEIAKKKSKYRDDTYHYIKDYLEDEATGDPYKMLKWTEGLDDKEIEKLREQGKKETTNK
jgi:DNA-binding transcriptional regulator YiaG